MYTPPYWWRRAPYKAVEVSLNLSQQESFTVKIIFFYGYLQRKVRYMWWKSDASILSLPVLTCCIWRCGSESPFCGEKLVRLGAKWFKRPIVWFSGYSKMISRTAGVKTDMARLKQGFVSALMTKSYKIITYLSNRQNPSVFQPPLSKKHNFIKPIMQFWLVFYLGSWNGDKRSNRPLRRPSFSSCKGLLPVAEAVFTLKGKKAFNAGIAPFVLKKNVFSSNHSKFKKKKKVI